MRNLITGVAAVLVVVTAAYTAVLLSQANMLREFIRSAARATAVDIDSTELLSADLYAGNRVEVPSDRAILLVGTGCEPCRQALDSWRKALADEPNDVAVLVVVTEDSASPKDLPKGWHTLRLSDPEVFRVRTGIRFQPMAFVLKGTNVLAAAAGVIDNDTMRRLVTMSRTQSGSDSALMVSMPGKLPFNPGGSPSLAR